MYPYIDPQAFANEQAMLQQRINQLEQARNQQMSMYAPQSQQQPLRGSYHDARPDGRLFRFSRAERLQTDT